MLNEEAASSTVFEVVFPEGVPGPRVLHLRMPGPCSIPPRLDVSRELGRYGLAPASLGRPIREWAETQAGALSSVIVTPTGAGFALVASLFELTEAAVEYYMGEMQKFRALFGHAALTVSVWGPRQQNSTLFARGESYMIYAAPGWDERPGLDKAA